MLDRDFIEQHTQRFRRLRGRRARHDLGRDRARIRPDARRRIEAAAQVYVEAERVIGIYGMGLTQHVHGFDNVAMLVNLLLLQGQYRPRRHRHLARARPFQRAGPAHRRHHREAGTRAARQARRAVRLRAAAREGHEHGRGLRGHPRRARSRPSSASAAISCAPIPERGAHGGGLDAAGADGADRDQAQPQPSRERQDRLSAALPRPHRRGRAGERPAGGHHGGQLQLHPRLARPAHARPASICCPSSRSSPASPRRPCRRTRRCDWDDWVGDYGADPRR